MPVIPVDFGNVRGDCETCSVGGRCMERMSNPAPPQRYSIHDLRSR